MKNTSKLKIETMKEDSYIARIEDKKLIIGESLLLSGDFPEIVSRLNSAGFALGSSHDSILLRKFQMDSKEPEFYYKLILEPYPGHQNQIVYFYKETLDKTKD